MKEIKWANVCFNIFMLSSSCNNEIRTCSSDESWLHPSPVCLCGRCCVVFGVCGQRRMRQLVLLLVGISSAPSTAATNLSAALICNGKSSKADWGLSRMTRVKEERRTGGGALSSASVTSLLLSVALFTLMHRTALWGGIFIKPLSVSLLHV